VGRRILSFAVCSFHRETFQLVLIAAKEKLEIVSGEAQQPFRIFAGDFPSSDLASGRNA